MRSISRYMTNDLSRGNDRWKDGSRKAKSVKDRNWPFGTKQIVTGLKAVAGIGCKQMARQPGINEIILVREPGTGGYCAMTHEPAEFGQRPGGLHGIAELLPKLCSSHIDRLAFCDRASIVIHERGRDRPQILINKKNCSRGCIHCEPCEVRRAAHGLRYASAA
ncbi:MAG TPA: hypothetical protein VFW83_07555 [Bryobacteraceae bacterium]|nr:hypothetical protein [Bryobacteraceae bacterium]